MAVARMGTEERRERGERRDGWGEEGGVGRGGRGGERLVMDAKFQPGRSERFSGVPAQQGDCSVQWRCYRLDKAMMVSVTVLFLL